MWIYNRYLSHSDGQTSHERRRGRTSNKSLSEFAETLLYTPMRQDTPKDSATRGIADDSSDYVSSRSGAGWSSRLF